MKERNLNDVKASISNRTFGGILTAGNASPRWKMNISVVLCAVETRKGLEGRKEKENKAEAYEWIQLIRHVSIRSRSYLLLLLLPVLYLLLSSFFPSFPYFSVHVYTNDPWEGRDEPEGGKTSAHRQQQQRKRLVTWRWTLFRFSLKISISLYLMQGRHSDQS